VKSGEALFKASTFAARSDVGNPRLIVTTARSKPVAESIPSFQIPRGKGQACRPIVVRGDADEDWRLRNISLCALTLFDQRLNRQVAHRLDRRIDEQDRSAKDGVTLLKGADAASINDCARAEANYRRKPKSNFSVIASLARRNAKIGPDRA
jgi:hypothetical protein